MEKVVYEPISFEEAVKFEKKDLVFTDEDDEDKYEDYFDELDEDVVT